ncbi:MAG: hypothetical protein ABUT20_18210 [Bacteroidota bacterium]
MTESIALKSLHLEYRLWIAELNLDINLIRIFNDRLLEIAEDKKSGTVKSTIEDFGKKFNTYRETIDELRHRMHIEKMNLAAKVRENNGVDYKINIPDNYKTIREDFFKFRVSFNELKSGFLHFEN